jgi:flagellar basal body L-ring protein FlgH
MQSNNNNNNYKKKIFANGEQKKFYQIVKAFKIGNILATFLIVLIIVKYFLGI